MTVPVISRSAWGAKPWRTGVNRVPMSEKRYFLVHYHGGPVRDQYGVEVPRNVEAIHLANGWSGVGYNFLVDLDGKVYEGRGWDGVGAQCPGRNRDGVGVYVAVGGDQKPTQAALRSVVALRDELKARSGRAPIVGYHGMWISTSCAGPVLIPWVKAGMPLEAVTPTPAPKPVVVPVVTPAPTPAKVTGLIKEDGLNGPGTRKAIQRMLGVTADGSWGPTTRKAIQKWAGVKQDGSIGPATRTAVQRKLGIKATGVWAWDQSTRPDVTTKALQAYYNRTRRNTAA